MKYGPFTAIMLACLLFSITAAEARNRPQIEVASGWGWGSSQAVTPIQGRSTGQRLGNLPGPCYEAARKGGPCGCWASIVAFGHSVRELWRRDAWYRFPRTSAHVGAAAIWRGHVAMVVAGPHGDGTVTVDDSWNHEHRVRAAGLTFVNPH